MQFFHTSMSITVSIKYYVVWKNTENYLYGRSFAVNEYSSIKKKKKKKKNDVHIDDR